MAQSIGTSTTKTILLIDDEDIMRWLVQTCLENFGHWQITVAISGKEGLKAIAKMKPDAILLDIIMPDMDGFTFIEKLKNDCELAVIPIIVITACTNLTSQTFTELGCKSVISKPFDPITLVPEIARILGWQ